MPQIYDMGPTAEMFSLPRGAK